jgi:hypothetical protein
MGISNIQLNLKSVNYGYNYIVNGDFSNNTLKTEEEKTLTQTIPGWEVAGNESIYLEKGSTLNSAWGDRTVVQLDFNKDILRQTIDLGCNKDVVLSFHCAGKTNYKLYARARVLWNG